MEASTFVQPALCGSILRARALRSWLSIEEELELSLAENGPQTAKQLVESTGARDLLRGKLRCVRALLNSLRARGHVQTSGHTHSSVKVSPWLQVCLDAR